jgi:NADPH2:quinone reductase
VFGTASTQEKLDYAAGLGCDHPINYVEDDFVEEIEEINGGEGVDLVLDGVGGEPHYDSYEILNHFGRVVAYGVASGEVPEPNVWDVLVENHSVIGFHLGQSMAHEPERVLGAVPDLENLLGSGKVEIRVGATFPLEEAAEGHRLIENREHTGKVVLTI